MVVRVARRSVALGALLVAFAVASTQVVLAAAGDPDASFGTGGIATLNLGAGDRGTAVTVHDGKIVVAGTTDSSGNRRFAVARFTSTGDPDPTFGGGTGFVTTEFGLGTDTVDNGLAVLPNGKILVVGYNQVGSTFRMALTRYRVNGTLDPTFGGGDGKVLKGFGSVGAVAYAVVLLPNGKFIVGGAFYGSHQDGAVAIWRFKANGTLDTTFGGGDGMATVRGGPGDDAAWQLLLMPGGDILAAGWASVEAHNDYDVLLARFHADGRLDRTFGLDGSITLNPTRAGTEFAAGVALTPGGKILVICPGQQDDEDIVLLRLKANGRPDPTFGGGYGKVVRDFGAGEVPQGVAVQGDGKIVVTGRRGIDLFVARFMPGGAPDGGFGTAGLSTVPSAEGLGVTLQPNGRILVAGQISDDLAVVRFRP